MDPTIAALVGAAFGALATALVPFMTIRARRREVEAERRRNDTVALLDALVRLLKARGLNDWMLYTQTHSEAVVAVERLLISAGRRDAEHIERVTNFVFESISDQKNLNLASVSVEAMSQVLRRWCRGELKGSRIADAYEPALDVQMDSREARWERQPGRQ